MTIPDDIKREADGTARIIWNDGELSREECIEKLSQALLSSRDQGYREGVEKALKMAKKAVVEAECKCAAYTCTGYCPSIPKAISSLKDKLKPKEKV